MLTTTTSYKPQISKGEPDICLKLIAEADIVERFRSKYQASPTGCWHWLGKLKNGYGRFCIGNRKYVYAHRFSFALKNNDLSSGKSEMVVDHICRNRACVNPSHLRTVTRGENVLIGETIATRNAAKTICCRGHLFTPENTMIDPKGRRVCRECKRLRDHTYSKNKRLRIGYKGHKNSQKIACPQGHLYAGDNLYVAPNGQRYCKTCRSQRRGAK